MLDTSTSTPAPSLCCAASGGGAAAAGAGAGGASGAAPPPGAHQQGRHLLPGRLELHEASRVLSSSGTTSLPHHQSSRNYSRSSVHREIPHLPWSHTCLGAPCRCCLMATRRKMAPGERVFGVATQACPGLQTPREWQSAAPSFHGRACRVSSLLTPCPPHLSPCSALPQAVAGPPAQALPRQLAADD